MIHTDLQQRADQLLLRLRSKPGKPITISVLAKAYKITPNEVIKIVDMIRSWGYRVKRSKQRGVTFVAAPDSLTATEISYGLKTKRVGRRIYAYQSVKSTNDLAWQLADQSEPEGTIVTAEEQTRGKGRLGRSWYSPAGTGIYVSIILRPEFSPEMAPGLSIMAALALAEAVKPVCGGKIQIKWPNDLLIDGRKVAGILTELSADKSRINHVVIGVGVNVNQQAGEFPDDIKKTATSIRRVNKRKAARVSLLQRFLTNLEREYAKYQKSQLRSSRKRVLALSSLIGSSVTIRYANHTVAGKAVDINYLGGLVLERDGRRIPITSGEVTVLK